MKSGVRSMPNQHFMSKESLKHVLKLMRRKVVSIVGSVKNVISFIRSWMHVRQKVFWVLIKNLTTGKLYAEERITILK